MLKVAQSTYDVTDDFSDPDLRVFAELLAAPSTDSSRSYQTTRPPQDILPRLEPGTPIGQYEPIRELGRGGMGSVVLARDTQLGRLVAIKLVFKRHSLFLENFFSEARATALCNHENIVILHEIDEFDGWPYMVLEYIAGQSLRDWLRDRRCAVPPALTAKLMIPVVRALVAAHDNGIVHRDLKPSNIMMSEAGGIKVLDLGIAKLFQSEFSGEEEAIKHSEISSTRTGTMTGTLPYMSPEQWGVSSIDHRTDIWALGVIMYEMVAGKHPLSPMSRARLAKVKDLRLSMPSAMDIPGVGDLGAIIDRCLIKNKEDRTHNARQLLQELTAIVSSNHVGSLDEKQNPFAGLSAFQESDADRFFGRDEDVASMVAKLQKQPLLAIVGPSGSGKSSLVRAGILPILKSSGEGWATFTIRPGRDPVLSLGFTQK